MAKKLLVKKLLNLKKFLKRIKKMNITIEEAIQLRLKISMEYCEKQGEQHKFNSILTIIIFIY